jgi:hypothetical protein
VKTSGAFFIKQTAGERAMNLEQLETEATTALDKKDYVEFRRVVRQLWEADTDRAILLLIDIGKIAEQCDQEEKLVAQLKGGRAVAGGALEAIGWQVYGFFAFVADALKVIGLIAGILLGLGVAAIALG